MKRYISVILWTVGYVLAGLAYWVVNDILSELVGYKLATTLTSVVALSAIGFYCLRHEITREFASIPFGMSGLYIIGYFYMSGATLRETTVAIEGVAKVLGLYVMFSFFWMMALDAWATKATGYWRIHNKIPALILLTVICVMPIAITGNSSRSMLLATFFCIVLPILTTGTFLYLWLSGNMARMFRKQVA